MENIGPREREIAKQYNLHHSCLVPATRGEDCPCCKKLRDFSHYITDAGVCVFCSVVCKGNKTCQVSESAKLDGPICPSCYSRGVEYRCDHWACRYCPWKTERRRYNPEPLRGINPNENICCDIGDDD